MVYLVHHWVPQSLAWSQARGRYPARCATVHNSIWMLNPGAAEYSERTQDLGSTTTSFESCPDHGLAFSPWESHLTS